MSHVATIDLEIKDLEALERACKNLGLELVKDQATYKWYGRHIGDYPVPEGFSVQDLGKCEHAIRVKGNPTAYEIGVTKRRDGKPGYTLLWDFWQHGFGLEAKIGAKGGLLKQNYSAEIARKQALRQGFKVTTKKTASGELVLTLRR
jgi:hypothetical protein